MKGQAAATSSGNTNGLLFPTDEYLSQQTRSLSSAQSLATATTGLDELHPQEPQRLEAMRSLCAALHGNLHLAQAVGESTLPLPHDQSDGSFRDWNKLLEERSLFDKVEAPEENASDTSIAVGAATAPSVASEEYDGHAHENNQTRHDMQRHQLDQASQKGQPKSSEEDRVFLATLMKGRMERALQRKQLTEVMNLFLESTRQRLELDDKLYDEIFDRLMDSGMVWEATKVLEGRFVVTKDASMRMLEAVCAYFESFPRKSDPPTGMVFKIIKITSASPRKVQEVILPRMLRGFLGRPFFRTGEMIEHVYGIMQASNIPVPSQLADRILLGAKFRSTGVTLPVAQILHDLVQSGYQPSVEGVAKTFVALSPFLDNGDTRLALQAIHDLNTGKFQGENGGEFSATTSNHPCRYVLDFGTLETISSTAAKKGDSELGLLVWDVMEQLGYHPNEILYENLAQTFAMAYRSDEHAFECLNEMESNGFKPSRAVIRSVSRSLRYSVPRLDNAHRIVMTEAGPSLTLLNTILSACAEQGDTNRAFATFDDMKRCDIAPDVDTYSFLLEAMANEVACGNIEEDGIASRLEAAEIVVDEMGTQGIDLSMHALHQFVRLQLDASNVDLVVKLVWDCLKRDSDVHDKTIAAVVNALLHAGRVDDAEELFKQATESIEYLRQRIDKYHRGRFIPKLKKTYRRPQLAKGMMAPPPH